MHGYFDPLEYAPKKLVNLKYNKFDFYEGHYYDKQGTKNEGFIKFNFKNFYFKKNKTDDKQKKLRTKDFSSFVVNEDSFFVFKYGQEIAQFVATINGYTYIRNFSKVSATSTGFTESYYISKPATKSWFLIPNTSKAFRKEAINYFDNLPSIKERIEKKEFSYNDLKALIKMSEYYEKYLKKEPIYFDDRWTEVENEYKAAFSVNILSVEDSVWSLEYFKGKNLLYKGEVTRLMPLRFHNEFTSYYENGNIRKKTIYKNGHVSKVTTYYPDGKKHYNYNELEVKRNVNGKRITKKMRTYNLVNDLEGNNIIALDNKGTENYKDEKSGHIYTNYFQLGQLQYAYREGFNGKIYSLSNIEFDFKSNRLNSFISNIDMSYYLDEIEKPVQDILLVRVIINEEGKIDSYSFLNETDSYIAKKIVEILNEFKKKKKFSKYELSTGEIVRYELIIPINIDISSFNSGSDPFKNWHHFNNMWFHQNMMNQPLNIQAPPAIRN